MEYATEMPMEVSEINAGEIRESVQSASGQHRRTTEEPHADSRDE